MDLNDYYHGRTGPMYTAHFNNILNPPVTPRSAHSQCRFCGENFEPLTDLPYTIIPMGNESPSSEPHLPLPPLSPTKTPCHSDWVHHPIPSLSPTPEQERLSIQNLREYAKENREYARENLDIADDKPGKDAPVKPS